LWGGLKSLIWGCELLLLGYVILKMARRGRKWDPERMKAAIEAMRNKQMGSYRASRVFTVPQTTLERCIEDREKSSTEAIKPKLGRKQVLSCAAENDVAEHRLLMERKFFGLTVADVMCLAYQLAVRNGIKNQFCKRNEKDGRKWLKHFLSRHPEILARSPEGPSLSKARGFIPESVAQVLKSTNPQWTPFNIILQDFKTATKSASLL
jgi:hypothetical protein